MLGRTGSQHPIDVVGRSVYNKIESLRAGKRLSPSTREPLTPPQLIGKPLAGSLLAQPLSPATLSVGFHLSRFR